MSNKLKRSIAQVLSKYIGPHGGFMTCTTMDRCAEEVFEVVKNHHNHPAPVTCGNGCDCLAQCGDTYAHAGLPKPPDTEKAATATAVPQGGFGIGAHALAEEVIVLLGLIEDDLDSLKIQDGQMPVSAAQWGKVARMADLARTAPAPAVPPLLSDDRVARFFGRLPENVDKYEAMLVREIEQAVRARFINAPAVPQGEPVACLVRQRTLRTRAAIAHDGKDHFSEWSDWSPATLKYGTAVTDPRRNSGPEHLFEMLPLVLATPAPAPAQEPVFCEFCGGNDDDPPQHCMDCARPDRTFTLDQIAAACAEAGVPDSKFEAISIAALRAKGGKL